MDYIDPTGIDEEFLSSIMDQIQQTPISAALVQRSVSDPIDTSTNYIEEKSIVYIFFLLFLGESQTKLVKMYQDIFMYQHVKACLNI